MLKYLHSLKNEGLIKSGGIMIIKRNFVFAFFGILLSAMLACDFSMGGNAVPTQSIQVQSGDAIFQATANALIIQNKQTADASNQANQALPPTAQPLPPTVEPPQPTAQPTAQPTVGVIPTIAQTVPAELILKVTKDRSAFYCVKSDGPITLTFTVEMSDIERGLAIFYSLYEKNSGTTSDWKNVSMVRDGATARTFTFNANVWDGKNNFFYPPGYGESWFQYQFVSGDAKDRTPVYRSDVTFFPCAQ
jgi:hypothetical protein